MAQSVVPPQQGAASFNCPRCGALAAQKWRRLYWSTPTDYENAYDATYVSGTTLKRRTWTMSECFACKQRAVWRESALIFPATSGAPDPHVDMPDEVRELYEEAAAVLSLSRRASAALARAALERLLKGLDPDAPKGSRLGDYIARASDKVSSPLTRLLTALRHIGNKSLHVDDEQDEVVALYLKETEPGLPELLFTGVNAVVDELITRPKTVEDLYGMLPEGVREVAERKAADQ